MNGLISSLTAEDIWIIATASLVAVSCALLGVFLVLRKMAMLGDAISHSVLLGIALAFLISASRAGIIMLIGALLIGILTALMTNFIHQSGRLQEDASMGVVFTTLFAIGVILISAFAGQIDLDLDCVLYGEIAFTPFQRLELFGGDWGPKAFWTSLVVALVNILFVTVFIRPLKLITFDPILAASAGVRLHVWHYALMALVSLTTVAAFDSVGAVLVVGLLVIPANVAYLVSASLLQMLIIAVLCGITASISGYALALAFDSSISASIIICAGLILLIIAIIGAVRCKKKSLDVGASL